jgi:hypothetical protein
MVLSDVELEVDGQVLKAHKVILMNGSTVFKTMFSHDTLEAAKNRVVIRPFGNCFVTSIARRWRIWKLLRWI